MIGYFAASDPAMREAFPANKQAGLATPFLWHALSYSLFYIGWEFHFRSFLQVGLSDSLGRTNAVLIQVMASSLMHIGGPFTETMATVGTGILWGWLAYQYQLDPVRPVTAHLDRRGGRRRDCVLVAEERLSLAMHD